MLIEYFQSFESQVKREKKKWAKISEREKKRKEEDTTRSGERRYLNKREKMS